MRYIFARHAEAQHTVAGRLSTAPPGPELSPAGHEEAVALAGSLSGLRPAAVYASPLTRTRQTAEVVARMHGLDVRLGERLAELRIGELEGAPVDEGFRILDRAWHRWVQEGDLDARSAPGGESAREILARFDAFVAEVRAAHRDGDHIVVIGHGGFLQLCLPARCTNLPAGHGQKNWLRSTQTVWVTDDRSTMRCESWAGRPIGVDGPPAAPFSGAEDA